jgi:hypothetical protein
VKEAGLMLLQNQQNGAGRKLKLGLARCMQYLNPSQQAPSDNEDELE